MNHELSPKNRKWMEETWKKIQKKIGAVTDRIGGMIPGDPGPDGCYVDMGSRDIFWWTNGFWSGILWQMYHATKEERYKTAAIETEEKLDEALHDFIGLHHDVGFMWLPSAVANCRLTFNKQSEIRGLHAASILAGRYNPAGRFIRAWNPDCDLSLDTRGMMIVDCMMNIPLLYWASDVTGDSRFRTIAREHADTVLRHTIRQDGSCNHIVQFDPDTGEVLDAPGGQGYGRGSSWSRGQSWALYGMALSFAHTGEERYLNAAKQVAHYMMANVAMNGYVPLVDFRAPKEPILVDTTAGMIMACGLLEIAGHVGELERELYVENAVRVLRTLERNYCDWDSEKDAILGFGTVAYHGRKHCPIIYGDYFLLEALLRLRGEELMIW